MTSSFFERLRPAEIATLAYISIELMIVLIFMAGKPGWTYLFLFYLCAAGIIFLMAASPFKNDVGFAGAVRTLYPVVLAMLFYRAVGPQLYLIFDQPFDSAIHNLELKILGADPAFALQKFIDIPTNELMSFGYFSFYLILPISIILFLIYHRRDSLNRIVLSAVVTYYICFLIFIFFPVTGPRFYLKDIYYLPIIGPFFTPLVRNIVVAGGHHGAAMPSSHCAITFVAVWRVMREFRKLAIPSIILILMVCAGAVYGRFHYLTDAVIGIIIGIFGVWVSNIWYNSFMRRMEKIQN